MKSSLIVLLFAFALARAYDPMDNLVDSALDLANAELVEQHKDTLKIMDVEQELKTKILGMTVSATINAKDGIFKNASTLYRIGKADVKQSESGALTVVAEVGLSELKIEYKSFNARALGLNFGDAVEVNCGSNGVKFNFTIATDDEGNNCTSTLNDIRLTQLGGLSISFKPSGFTNWMKSHLMSWGLYFGSGTLYRTLNEQIQVLAPAAIQQIDVCELFNF